MSPGRGRGAPPRGRGALRARGRGSRGRGRGVPVHAVVDHRPRALGISGFTEAERVDLLPHFAVSQLWKKKCDIQFGFLMGAVGGRSKDYVLKCSLSL